MTEQPQPAARAGNALRVLLLNHHRDSLEDLVEGLRRAGFEVVESTSLVQTANLLRAESGAERAALGETEYEASGEVIS